MGLAFLYTFFINPIPKWTPVERLQYKWNVLTAAKFGNKFLEGKGLVKSSVSFHNLTLEETRKQKIKQLSKLSFQENNRKCFICSLCLSQIRKCEACGFNDLTVSSTEACDCSEESCTVRLCGTTQKNSLLKCQMYFYTLALFSYYPPWKQKHPAKKDLSKNCSWV